MRQFEMIVNKESQPKSIENCFAVVLIAIAIKVVLDS